jgi:hypothetical protein
VDLFLPGGLALGEAGGGGDGGDGCKQGSAVVHEFLSIELIICNAAIF